MLPALLLAVVAAILLYWLSARQQVSESAEEQARAVNVYAEENVSRARWPRGAWPFTVSSGVVVCEGPPGDPFLFFRSPDGLLWPLNGRARTLASERQNADLMRGRYASAVTGVALASRQLMLVLIVPLQGPVRWGRHHEMDSLWVQLHPPPILAAEVVHCRNLVNRVFDGRQQSAVLRDPRQVSLQLLEIAEFVRHEGA